MSTNPKLTDIHQDLYIQLRDTLDQYPIPSDANLSKITDNKSRNVFKLADIMKKCLLMQAKQFNNITGLTTDKQN